MPETAGDAILTGPLPGSRMTAFRAGAPVSAIVPRTLGELAMVANAIISAGMAPDSYVIEPEKIKADEIHPEIAAKGSVAVASERWRIAEDKTKARIMIGIMKGAEVGLPPITALSTIAIINNRPCIFGDGAMALIQSSGQVERYVEYFESEENPGSPLIDEMGNIDHSPQIGDFPRDFTAVCKIWRKGQDEPYVGRFSVRDAQRAGLWGDPKRKPWLQHPKRMLRMRARSFPMRDGFADCLFGLAIREEIEDLPPEEPPAPDLHFLETPTRKEVVPDASTGRPAAADNTPPPLVGGEPDTPGPASERKESADDGAGYSISGRVSDEERDWWKMACDSGKYGMRILARNAGTAGRDRMLARVNAAPTKEALVAFISSNTTALQQIHLVSPAAAEEVREAMARKAQEFGE